MQTDASIFYSYMYHFLYPLEKPHLAMSIVSSCNLAELPEAPIETKLQTLGALLSLQKFDTFMQTVQRLSFKEIPEQLKGDLPLGCKILMEVYLSRKAERSAQLSAAALLQLLIAISPELILAHQKPINTVTSESLVNLEYADSIHLSVKGIVFSREFIYGPGSRKHEFGHRIQTALASQGWQVGLLPADQIKIFSSDILYDFAMVDTAAYGDSVENLFEIVSHLKRFFRKVFVLNPDPWDGFHNENLSKASDFIDYLWGFSADWEMVHSPPYKDRVLVFPNVGGFDHLAGTVVADPDWNSCTFNFTGSVEYHNINRIYWILEIISRNLNVDINISQVSHDDHLDREASLNLYAQKLASTNASLNMITRCDGSRILTGRSIEVISLKRLLIQEKCPAFKYYFVEGEHFLEFSCIDELATIHDFLRAHPAAAKTISQRGYQYYHEKYSCKKMVEHIQTFL